MTLKTGMPTEARWKRFIDSASGELPDVDELATALRDAIATPSGRFDLGQLISHWSGLRLSFMELEGPGYLVDLGDDLGELMIRSADPAVRQRFTIAHELGHWMLGNPHSGAQNASLRNNRKRPQIRGEIEAWCDAFAVALLVPSKEILGFVSSDTREGLWGRLAALPSHLDVSRDVAWKRYAQVTSSSVVWVRRGHDKRILFEPSQFASPSQRLAFKSLVVEVGDSLEPGAVTSFGDGIVIGRIPGTSDVLAIQAGA